MKIKTKINKWCWEKSSTMCNKMKLSNTIHKNKLKMDYRSKCKTRKYKTLRGKHRQKLDGINQSKILYDPPPKVTEIKTKVNKWYLIKLKSFCIARETISKVKRQPSE